MASRIAQSHLPLWRRRIPRYPVYWPGNPQLRVPLPLFWMKIVKPAEPFKDNPSDRVHFRVHPEMTEFDVKQYLDKIYNVKVLNMRVETCVGKDIKHPKTNRVVARDDTEKYVYVHLAGEQTFEFPDLFTSEKGKKTTAEKDREDFKKATRAMKKDAQDNWAKIDIPSWYR